MKMRVNFSKGIGLTLFLIGAVSLAVATIYASPTPELIGLGLVFWGIILTYIQPDVYIKKTILDSVSMTLIANIDETLTTLEYKGKAVYLPPKYFNNPESIKIYVPKQETGTLPSPEAIQELETQSSRKNGQGILITPPGADLTRLLERSLGTNFITTNLETLEQRLPKAFIEDLEIMTDCEIQTHTNKTIEHPQENTQTNQNTILVKFTTTAYRGTCKRANQLPTIYSNIGCPLSSAFAIAFARATGKPITIKTQNTSQNGETNETQYTIVEEQIP